jgi:hypothetical protein
LIIKYKINYLFITAFSSKLQYIYRPNT